MSNIKSTIIYGAPLRIIVDGAHFNNNSIEKSK